MKHFILILAVGMAGVFGFGMAKPAIPLALTADQAIHQMTTAVYASSAVFVMVALLVRRGLASVVTTDYPRVAVIGAACWLSGWILHLEGLAVFGAISLGISHCFECCRHAWERFQLLMNHSRQLHAQQFNPSPGINSGVAISKATTGVRKYRTRLFPRRPGRQHRIRPNPRREAESSPIE